MRKSRLSRYKQSKLIELFISGPTVRMTASLVGVNKITVAYYLHRLRQLIDLYSKHLEMFDGEIEADESYFGSRRKGKRGCDETGKVPVFGLLKRDGKVYTVMVANTQMTHCYPLFENKSYRTVLFTPIHIAVMMYWM